MKPGTTLKYVVLACVLNIVAGCTWTGLVSQSSSGELANGNSYYTAISADGRYVAFLSYASNLVDDDVNAKGDVFVRDNLNHTTERVSVGNDGIGGNGHSSYPSISGSGRYVAFSSAATNLVANDTNNTSDIFVHDRHTHITSRLSVDSLANEGNDASTDTSISADGRYVAFTSQASNLVAGDTGGADDIFVHDRETSMTTRVSVDTAGNEGNFDSYTPVISGSGRFVAFRSLASNLVAGDTNLGYDIFVHDLDAGTTSRVSVDSAGNQSDGTSRHPAITYDGRYVAFASWDHTLVEGDTNSGRDIFVHDRETGNTSSVTVGLIDNGITDFYNNPAISWDGRYVGFKGTIGGPAVPIGIGTPILLHDRATGATSWASSDAVGTRGNSGSDFPSISGDGRYVSFYSASTNLVPDDTNGFSDIFIRAIPEVTVASVIPHMLPIGSTTSVTITGTNFLPGATPVITAMKTTVGNVLILDENTMTADVTVSGSMSSGTSSLVVNLPGTGPGPLTGATGICAGCLTFY